jgi:hypothetical protein
MVEGYAGRTGVLVITRADAADRVGAGYSAAGVKHSIA